MNAETSVCCRITAAINRAVSASVNMTAALRDAGIRSFSLVSGRNAVLHERTGLFGTFMPGKSLESNPVDMLTFFTAPADEDAALAVVTSVFGLDGPGRGSVYSESVAVNGPEGLFAGNSPAGKPGPRVRMQSGLTGIFCIVQRGEGDVIARTVLEAGVCAPTIGFGVGTGVRDKLGILRITIPAEKELINVVTGAHDAGGVLDMLVDAGKLDLPGKGFVYLYEVSKGVIDTRVSVGASGHAASMDQVIFAIDELKGGTQWRHRNAAAIAGGPGRSGRKYLSRLVDMSVMCDEGRADELVKAAMSAGAAGATISKYRFVQPQDAPVKASPARERSNLIVGENQVSVITAALEKAGLFDDQTHGQILTRGVPKACTYLGK